MGCYRESPLGGVAIQKVWIVLPCSLFFYVSNAGFGYRLAMTIKGEE